MLLGRSNNILFRAASLKEPEHAMLMIHTCGALVRFKDTKDNDRIENEQRINFRYSENI